MKDVVYVTGNANKAKYFSKLIGRDVLHAAADVPEIQSLDLEEIVIAKVKAAYGILKRPVLVEDTSLTIACMGKLPGPFIKWFLEELSQEDICKLANSDPSRAAVATCMYAYFDGTQLEVFKGENVGSIPDSPRGDAGFGWNPIFIPKGSTITLGEMDEATFSKEYLKIKPIADVRKFLDKL